MEDKTKFKRLILVFVASLFVSGCAGQEEDTSTNTNKEEEHLYSPTYEKDESGHWHKCLTNGHSDISKKEAHKYGEWKILIEAGLHTDQIEHRFCSICEYEEKRTVEDSGTHSFVWKYDDNKHWQESTCDHETPLTKDEGIHLFGEWKVLNDADIHVDKVEYRLCSVCLFTEKRTIENTATHTFSQVWSFDETNHWHESTCDHTPSLKSDISAHSFGEWKEKVAATYTSNRIDERKCIICDFAETKEIENSKLIKQKQELTLKTIAPRIFDGYEKAVAESDLVFASKAGGLIIEYRLKGTDTYSTNVPFKAGTYQYRVTLGETDIYAETSSVGEFVIEPKIITLPSSLFEKSVTLAPYGLSICEIDVSESTNNRYQKLHIVVPTKYGTVGRHTIPSSELRLKEPLSNGEDCFKLDFGTISSISLVNYDKKVLIAGVSSDSITNPSGGIIIKTKIVQGSVSVNESIYIYELNKSVTVSDIKLKSGESINKATANDEISLYVTGISNVTSLSPGMIISKADNFVIAQSAYAIVALEKDISSSLINGTRLTVSFPYTFAEYEANFTLPADANLSDDLFEHVRLDFSKSFANWQDREFVIKTGTTKIGEGIIEEIHTHDATFASDGICSCGLNNSLALSFASSTNVASSGLLPYFKEEVRVFTILLKNFSTIGGGLTSTTFMLSLVDYNDSSLLSQFSVKAYNSDTNELITLSAANKYSIVVYGIKSINLKVVVKRTGGTSYNSMNALFKITKS